MIGLSTMYNKFLDTIQKLHAESFPYINKTVNVGLHKNHRPWITRGIKKSITKKEPFI